MLDGQFDDSFTWGFAGVLERPFAGDFNLDGIDDFGLMVPDQDGTGPGVAEWYVLRSVAANKQAGTINSLKHPFSPTPVGNDLFAKFGNNISVPVVGNFDPPLPAVVNSAPRIASNAGTDFGGKTTLNVSVQASDPQGDKVSITAVAESTSGYWDRTLGLSSTVNYNTNWGGKKEKWVKGSDGSWFFILPSGELYKWNRSKIAAGTLVAKLDASVYDNPDSLVRASEKASPVRAVVINDQVTLTRDAGFWGSVIVTMTASDGLLSTSSQMTVNNTGGKELASQLDRSLGLVSANSFQQNWGGRAEKWLKGLAGWYFILPDGSLFSWDKSKNATGTLITKLDKRFYDSPNLLANAEVITTDQTLGFKSNGNLNLNWAGQKEQWFQDKNNAWYYILQDGAVYKWSGQAKKATGTLVKRYESADYQAIDRVFNAFDNVMLDWLAILD